jgi:tungstate transport system permease protein
MEFLYEQFVQALQRLANGDTTTWTTAWRTIRLALESTAIALVIGVPVGVRLGEGRTRLRRVGLTLANTGLGLPPVVLGVALALLLTPAGPLGGLRWLYTQPAVVFAQVLLALPIVIALTAAAVGALPAGLLDQARAFGASWPRRMVFAVREARVGVLTAVMTAFGSALAEVGAVVIVGGNVAGHTNTLASTVLLDLSGSDPAGATAHVIVLLALVAVVGLALTWIQQGAER